MGLASVAILAVCPAGVISAVRMTGREHHSTGYKYFLAAAK